MRIPVFIAIAALALSGCSDAVENAVSDKAAAEGEGWTMQVLGDDKKAIYLVTGPDGKSAAASLEGGVSTLIGDAEAQGFMAQTQTALAADAPPEKVSIAAPGVSIKVAADDNENGGRGKVAINVGGISINVDGDDANGDGRGAFRIAGVNEEAATKFIEEIDDLSPEVKARMREKLGL